MRIVSCDVVWYGNTLYIIYNIIYNIIHIISYNITIIIMTA